jgi:restriction system protein
MPLPKFYETFIPVLDVLKDGVTLHHDELRRRVRDVHYNHLTEEDLTQRTKSGDPLILNRIGWAKAYLKMAKLIEQPERARVKITPKGLEVLKRGSYTLKELKADPIYLDHKLKKKEKKQTEESVDDLNIASPQDLIESGVESIEQSIKSELLERLKDIDPYYFEKVILVLLNRMGYGEMVETKKSGDGGVDGIINQDKLGLDKIFMQAKRYNDNKVRETEIRNFIGAMSGDTSKGVFVTTSEFDAAAVRKASQAHHKIILIDGSKLVDLMHQHNVGVQVKEVYEVKELDEDFFE